MMLPDFIFYFLTYYFDNNRQLLSWSSPLQRSTYVIGLATLGVLVAIEELLEFTVLKPSGFQVPKLAFILIGLGVIQLYDFVYIKRNRYERVVLYQGRFASISKSAGVTIVIACLVLCFLSPFFMFMVFVPFGGHTLKH